MLSLTLGPFAWPVGPVLLFGAAAASALLASRLAPREQRGSAVDAVVAATLWGLLGARLGYLLANVPLYLAHPLSALDVRDGGWWAPAGAVFGAAYLLWRARRTPALARPLALAALAGVLLWSVAGLGLRLAADARMPALALQRLDGGGTLSLQQAARGRPVVVNLWASWCAPCRQDMPVLAQAQQRDTEVGFLFVNQGETAARVRAFLAAERLPLREVWLDPDSAVGPAVGSPGLPTTLFYDAAGRLQGSHVGVINAAALEARLRRLRSTD